MTELSAYVLEPIREGPDFTLYRGRQHGNPSPVLAVTLAAEDPSPQNLRRLEHEYSLAAELDSAWAAKPLALTRHEGRTILILMDPGGEPLDLVLQRGQLDLTWVLRIAIGLATALGQVHRRGLIHKDLKPGNILVDDAGKVWLTGFAIASRLPQERQAPAPPEILAGTLVASGTIDADNVEEMMRIAMNLTDQDVQFLQELVRIMGSLVAMLTDDTPAGWVPLAYATQALGVSRQTVLQKVKRGELRAVLTRTGRRKGLRIEVPAPQDGLF